MPTPPLENTLEGGTNTTTISNANSGGASGDAFSTITGSPTFSTLQAAHGSLSARLAMGGTFAVTRLNWTALGSFTSSVYFRWYMRLPTTQTAGNMEILRVQTSAAAQSTVMWQNATTGVIRFATAANSGIAATLSTTALPNNQWIRIEARVLSSTTVGEVEWRLFLTPDSTTADETKSATGVALGANTDQVYFGLSNVGPTNVDFFYDDLAVSTTDWIGPVSTGPTGPPPNMLRRWQY